MTTAAIAMGANVSPPTAEKLPPLRDDLELVPGNRSENGTPSWSLYDPVRHSFYRIGWQEFEILSRWQLGDADLIAEQICQQTTLSVSAERVAQVERFLSANSLLRQASRPQKSKGSLLETVISIFYQRIPLWHPDGFLEGGLPFVRFFYSRAFWWLTFVVGLCGMYLVGRQWELFLSTFLHFFTLPGLLLFAAVLITVKCLHELAHGFTAKYYGLKVPIMGVAFIIIWPLLYTDTTDAWRLNDKRQRLRIAVAGVLLELAIAAYATFLWSFLAPGPLKSVMFVLATTTCLATLAVNLNPFMRFDGYYLLADSWDIPNLQPRSFALARWYVRRFFFGMDMPCPENLPAHDRRLMILYAVGTWLYRVVLFSGIALMVYMLTFKSLGLILLAVQLSWFIGRPVLMEMGSWWQHRGAAKPLHLFATCLLVAGVALLFGYPWHTPVEAPALYRPAQMSRIYAPQSGRLVKKLVERGDAVKKGDLLFVLHSPRLVFLERQATTEVERLQLELKRASFAEKKADHIKILEQSLIQALTAKAGYKEQKARLNITAPNDGIVVELSDSLFPGRWLAPATMLALVASPTERVVEGFFIENDLARIEVGSTGIFYADDTEYPKFSGTVTAIDQTHTTVLPEPYLASTYGGTIATREARGGKLMSEESLFRFQMRSDSTSALPLVLRGMVRLKGKPMSLMQRCWLAVNKVLIRESDF